MAYTNAWDETVPADTQLANLLGLDIRNLELNIRERVASFGAGLFANRPTPEAVWGAANVGVIYVATDTNQIFRWNGAAWLDVTTGVLSSNGPILKHKRFATGNIVAGSTANVSFNWASNFADANYTLALSVNDSSGKLQILSVVTQINSGIAVIILNTDVVDRAGTLNAIAIHD